MNYTLKGCGINTSLEMFTNTWFQAGVAVNFSISLLSVVANLLLFICFLKLSVSHKNIRILSCNLSGACIVASGFFVGRSIAVWANAKSHPCNLHMTLTNCTMLSAPCSVAVFAMIASMIGIAIERARATLAHASYTNDSKRFGIVMSIAAWLLYLVIVPLGQLGEPQLLEAPFCINVVMSNVLPSFILSCIMVVLASGTIVVYTKLIAINKRRLAEFATGQVQLTLSSRMEIRQSVELTSLFLFTIIIYTILEIGFALLIPIGMYIIAEDMLVPRFLLGLIINNFTAAFMAAHPIWFFSKSVRLRNKLRSIFRTWVTKKLPQCKVDTTTPASNQEDDEDWRKSLENHFQMLRGTWSVKETPETKGKAYVIP